MFGTSGIRGLYGKEVTPQLAMRVGNAAGAMGKKIAVATDTRATSPILSEALSSGAMLSGADVIDLGVAPTPLLAYATFKWKCAGAMITASHNPPEYNGIKLFFSGMEFSRQQERGVEERVGQKENAAEWKSAGQKSRADLSGECISFLLSKVDVGAIKKRRLRVLVDAANAAAYSLAPKLFRAAGCEVVEAGCDSPGKFTRNLEPKASTLTETAKLVVKNRCDFGVAFDGDGDRAIAIDEKGNTLALDVQLELFCSHFLSKQPANKRIVTTVEASLGVRETVEEAGGSLFITPVGSLHVAQEVLRQKAAFGGEPCGEYVFPFATPCADGLLSALFIAEIVGGNGTLSQAAAGMKTHFLDRRKYKCGEGIKQRIMEKLSERPQLEGKLTVVDGLRYDFEDGWLLIRASGTEPAIRLTCESTSQKRLSETVQRAEHIIMNAIDAVR